MSWNDDTKNTVNVPPTAIDSDSTCANLPFGSPEWLVSLCSCQAALNVDRKVYQDYVRDFNQFQAQDAAYRNYLTGVSNHAIARTQYQLKNYDGVRWTSPCADNADNVPLCASVNPNYVSVCDPTYAKADSTASYDWGCEIGRLELLKKVSPGDCQGDGVHFNACRYTPDYIHEMMAQWDLQNPPPAAVPPPVQVAPMQLSNLMCCDQSIDNVTTDQAKVGNMIQNCQLTLQTQLANNSASLPVPLFTFPPTTPPSFLPTPTSSSSSFPTPTSSSSSSTPTPSSSSKNWAQEHPAVIIGAALALLGVVIAAVVMYFKSSSSSNSSASSE